VQIQVNDLLLLHLTMSMLDKFKKGAQKAAIQATAFAQQTSNRAATEGRDFIQGFSLPGEAEKAAKILDSFLGPRGHPIAHFCLFSCVWYFHSRSRKTRISTQLDPKGCTAESAG
jgi:hypothetical protein